MKHLKIIHSQNTYKFEDKISNLFVTFHTANKVKCKKKDSSCHCFFCFFTITGEFGVQLTFFSLNKHKYYSKS